MASTFHFRLQKLLELRRLREQESAGRVGAAQREAEAARVAVQQLDEVRRTSAQVLSPGQGTPQSAGELQQARLVLAHLDEHIAGASSSLEQAQQVMAERVAEYRTAARQRSVLDRLRERQRDLWRIAENIAERKELDEIAVLRHQPPRPDTAEV